MNEGNSHPSASCARDPSAKAIQRRAAEWLALRQARRLTLAEEADFADWRTQDPRHAAHYAEVEAAWQAFDTLADYPHSLDLNPDPDLLVRPRRVSRFVAPAVLAAAAAIAIVAAVRFQTTWSGNPDESAAIAHTDAGLVHLSDGTEVEVHFGGEIVEHFTPHERGVRLVRGEAYFTVAKNPDRPFVVEAGGVALRALGTAFNVRLPSDQTTVEVLVTEGSVQVAPPISRVAVSNTGVPSSLLHSSADLDPPRSEEAAILTAGQRTVISTRASGEAFKPVVETLAAAEIDRALSWQTGRFILDSTPLAEVVERFNRHAAGRKGLPRLVVTDPQLRQMKISGRIRAENIESFVEVLEANFNVVTEHRASGEIVLKRR